jgi:hypothetical protein
VIERFLGSPDPAIRRLAGDDHADVFASERVRTLLAFPDAHPYTKWWGTHWRLVSLADLGVPTGTAALVAGVEQELGWLCPADVQWEVPVVEGLVRAHASVQGNAVYACVQLGFATDPRVRTLVASLLEWQWPDGGWNCDDGASAHRSSFHETVTPALGLAAYHAATQDPDALAGARRTAELLLEHRLFRAAGSGDAIHPSWTKPHFPPYWHYDILQGLRLVQAVGALDDARAADALDLLERGRRRDGRFSGPAWWSAKQPDAVDWGPGTDNEMLDLRVEILLRAAGRA